MCIALCETSPLVLNQPTASGLQLTPVKVQSRLQAIKHRDSLLEESLKAAKAQIKEAVDRAWNTYYQKAKAKKWKLDRQSSYFNRFEF